MAQYNGHKNRNAWNVALWLFNDEPTYRMMVDLVRRNSKDQAAKILLEMLPTHTPDGVKYTYTNVRLALNDC